MNLRVHMERLVLDGIQLAAADRPRLQAAVEQELAALLARGGLHPAWLSGGATPVVRGGAFSLAPGTGAVKLGEQIARAVYGGIGR